MFSNITVSKITGLMVFLSLALLSTACHVLPEVEQVTLTHGTDQSAGGVSAYVVKISNATFYLEKEGGGFPNAIHRQDGNYFHAMNTGTDSSSSYIEIESAQHVRIIFTSDNGNWQGQWDFYPDRCDFTMTKVSQNYHYWVQYEGVPGGAMDDSDFWYASADDRAHPIGEQFEGDLPAPEWFAFGDEKTSRMIYLLHHEDDSHPDDYVSRPYMTVLGFGRSAKNKFLNRPQTFSIGFVESSKYEDLENTINGIIP